MRRQSLLFTGLVTVLGTAALAYAQTPVGTAITYQGRLTDGGSPASGAYDFEFRLYDALTVGGQVGTTVSIDDQPVNNGLFSVSLDFGSGAFTGDARWLETAVRPGGSSDPADFVALSPRQPITPAPYALHAMSAAGAATTKSGSGSIAVDIPDTSSQTVLNLSFGYTFATAPAVMVTGTTASGSPTLLVAHAANITATGFDLVLSNPSGASVSGLYSFNWIATATGGSPQTWYRDGDGDGYSDGSSQTREGSPPPGYYPASALTATSGDCDDTAAAVHPGVAEECDNIDNDCDGQIDVRPTTECNWDVGVCHPTDREICRGPFWVCDYGPGYEPEEETCDWIDNDCDGRIDEDLVGEPCPLQQGVCAGTTTVCDSNGGVTCEYPPSYEQTEATCDGLDNDCDGIVDEGTGGAACPLHWGVCNGVVTICQGGVEICDYGPSYEEGIEFTCDGLDNDCDAVVDEGTGGAPCPLHYGVCSGKVTVCQGAMEVCDYGPTYEEIEETCDGLDNDCDGVTDEDTGGVLCGMQDGVCAGAVTVCLGGTEICDYGPNYEEFESLCDGLDNDCDGETDEGC